MNVRTTDHFLADIERQYDWYVTNAGFEVADRYLDAVQATSHLLSLQPRLGPQSRFTHPKLKSWRYFMVLRPFGKHIVFYEIHGDEIILRRAMHGHRDLPNRLLDIPAAE